MDLNQFEQGIKLCVDHLIEELAQIRTGRATPEILHSVNVEAYGTQSPLKNVANISTADAKSLIVQPWDKTILQDVMRGLQTSDLGVSPSIEGDFIRVILPDLTEERRKEYVKIMKDRVETARIAVRNVRQKFMKEIDVEIEGGLSEDAGKSQREEIERQVKVANEQIESIREEKEKEIMTI